MVWGYFSWVGPLLFLMLQHTKTFWTMLCFQLFGHILGKALFYSSMTVHKARLIKTWLDVKNLTGPHIAQP